MALWSKGLAIKDTMGPSGGCQTRFRTRVKELVGEAGNKQPAEPTEGSRAGGLGQQPLSSQ